MCPRLLTLFDEINLNAELQIRGGIEDNSKIILLINKNICYNETVLTAGDKICFYGEIWSIIPKLSLLLLLIWSSING